jgi:integrase
MTRQQLAPQIKKIEAFDRRAGKTVVRYELRVDGGVNPATGQRQQVKRRFVSEREARDALAEIGGQAAAGMFVPRKSVTVEQVCAEYLAGRHNLRESARAKLEYDLGPLRQRYGDMPVQQLTKAHLDTLVTELVAGGTKTAKAAGASLNRVVTSS